jgi:PDDEXK-like domain of unknown function (DUF3799)
MVSGPQTESINNSGLGKIKRILTGGAPFLGGERFLQFGTEFHYRCLERKKGRWRPTNDDEANSMAGMVKSLHTCKLFLKNLPGAIVEKTIFHPKAFAIHPMHGTLDLRKKRIGIDLKTTSSETEEDFISKALKLSYPRQGVVYEELADLDEFYIIGIGKKNMGTKQKPFYPHWVMDLNNFQNEKRRAHAEAKFLLTFFKEYGTPTKTGVKEKPAFVSGQDSE